MTTGDARRLVAIPFRHAVRLAALPALVLTLGFAGASPSLAALSPKAFLETPAAAAFKAGDYDGALAGFQQLLDENRGDPLVLRYLAITLDRLERHEEAIEVLREALAASPDNAALHYFLGVAAWKARQVDLATESFRKSVALAPDSAYADKARDYLGALESQIARDGGGDGEGATRDWNLALTAGLQYDDNVPAAAEGLEDGGLRGYESLTGDVVVFESGGLRLKGLGFVYFSHHTERDNQDFDLMVFEPGAELGYAFEAFGIPTLASARYTFDFTLTEGSPFSSTHEVTTAIAVRPHEAALTRLHHRLSIEEFKEDGINPPVTSRDGIDNAAGITQYVFCCGQEHYLFGGYEFSVKNARGDNFDRHSHKITGGLGVLLPYDVRVELFGEYAADDYGNFVSTRSRQTHRHAASVVVKKELFEDFTGSFSYSFTDENTNFEALDYTRHVLGVAGTYRF